MDKCLKVAALYIASLKGLVIIHQHNHWTSKGSNFYGNHLLFERIYNSALEDLDLAAEKFIGLFGVECINYDLQTELLNKVLSKYKNATDGGLAMSLVVEKDFIKFSGESYKCFESEGKLSLGLDDMIMAISSTREGSVYLLQQNLE